MVVGLIIYSLVGLFIIGIGIMQIKSKSPVGFYTGEEPPKLNEVADVISWNKKHGIMWLIYGCVIIISFIIGMLIQDDSFILIPMLGGIIAPLLIMVLQHHRLKNKYIK